MPIAAPALALLITAAPARADEFVASCSMAILRKAPDTIPKDAAEKIATERCECVGRHLSTKNKDLFIKVSLMASLPEGDPRADAFRRSFGSDERLARSILDMRTANQRAADACDRESRE